MKEFINLLWINGLRFLQNYLPSQNRIKISKWAKMDQNYTFWNIILLFCVHFFQNQSKLWQVNQKHLWKERGAQKFRLDNVTKSVICTCMVALHFSRTWTWHDFDYYLYTAQRCVFQFLFRWIHYCLSSKSIGKETDKTHLCAVARIGSSRKMPIK